MITVRYSSVDGFKAKRTFKTVAAARAYAVARVGAGAEVSRSGYAISGDGVGKITVEGIDLGELLTGTKAASQGAYGLLRVYNCETHNGSDLIGRYDTVEEQMLALDRHAQHDHAECYHLAADLIDGHWVRIVPLYNGKTASEVMAETYPEGPF